MRRERQGTGYPEFLLFGGSPLFLKALGVHGAGFLKKRSSLFQLSPEFFSGLTVFSFDAFNSPLPSVAHTTSLVVRICSTARNFQGSWPQATERRKTYT